jgi:catechol 2,3-dioxygenase-like lactoylglutathione lyase family enzyme
MAILESNITIKVKDISKSIAFYESIGFTLKKRWDNYYAQVIAPGITIGLHPGNSSMTATNSDNISIGFTTDNFYEAKNLLDKLSINVQPREEEGGQFLHFNDPDGTPLYFIKSKW